jgi:hypothetical protein
VSRDKIWTILTCCRLVSRDITRRNFIVRVNVYTVKHLFTCCM